MRVSESAGALPAYTDVPGGLVQPLGGCSLKDSMYVKPTRSFEELAVSRVCWAFATSSR